MLKTIQLKRYDENTGQYIDNVYPITNSESVIMKDDKTLQETFDEHLNNISMDYNNLLNKPFNNIKGNITSETSIIKDSKKSIAMGDKTFIGKYYIKLERGILLSTENSITINKIEDNIIQNNKILLYDPNGKMLYDFLEVDSIDNSQELRTTISFNNFKLDPVSARILIVMFIKEQTEFDEAESNETILALSSGYASIASGNFSNASGYFTKANGIASSSTGSLTNANANFSHAEGLGVISNGKHSHGEGYYTLVNSNSGHAEGMGTLSGGYEIIGETSLNSTNDPYKFTISSDYANIVQVNDMIVPQYKLEQFANITQITQLSESNFLNKTTEEVEITLDKIIEYPGYSFLIRPNSLTTSTHAEGNCTTANGNYSHVEGSNTSTKGVCSHAEGNYTKADGSSSHAEGSWSIATGKYSHAEGDSTESKSDASHSEGSQTVATGKYSHSEGQSTNSIGIASHAEGFEAITEGDYSHAEGNKTKTVGEASHAEGLQTQANGKYSHVEGNSSIADGETSHAEGYSTEAIGMYSHAEGSDTKANGIGSHSEGVSTLADGNYSHAQGHYTIANGLTQTAIGRYNVKSGNKTTIIDTDAAFIIGNGTGLSEKSNAFKIDFNGQVFARQSYRSNGANYSEMFEWADGNPNNEDRIGKFVTFEKRTRKIRIANNTDKYILGVITANSAIVGYGYDEECYDKYVKDKFGRIQYEEKLIDGITVKVPKITSSPFNTTKDDYIPIKDRKEWDAVGLLGRMNVYHDLTCYEGDYCSINENGIATKSDTGYYVTNRFDDVIQILFK